MEEHASGRSHVFSYQKLAEPESIRLIRLEANPDPAAEIQCYIIHTALLQGEDESSEPFTALSYVWGDATNLMPVRVDEVTVFVTQNLFQALKDIRDKEHELLVWANAICINQTDDEEKSIQVDMMAKIYATADQTIIHLEHISRETASLTAPLCSDLSTPQFPVAVNGPEIVQHILRQSWFRRVWVFQELISSRRPWVQYGTIRWLWKHVYDHVLECFQKRVSLQPNIPTELESQGAALLIHMESARKKYQVGSTEGHPSSLLEIMQHRRGLGATEPRDMINAHVGLASDGSHETYTANYSKPCSQVYQEFAAYQIRSTGSYDILCHIEDVIDPTRLIGLASWALNWKVVKPTTLLLYNLGPCYINHKAINALLTRMDVPSVLTCVGVQVDELVRCSPTLSKDRFSRLQQRQLSRRLQSLCDEFRSRYAAQSSGNIIRSTKSSSKSENYILRAKLLFPDCLDAWTPIIDDEAILRSSVTGRHDIESTERIVDLFEHHFLYQGCRASLHPDHRFSDRNTIYFKKGTTADHLVIAVATSVPHFSKGRSLARLASGFLAFVPNSARNGDIVCALDDAYGQRYFLVRSLIGEQDQALLSSEVIRDS